MENLEKWRDAGRIAAEALEFGRKLIKNGAVIREVCDKIDEKIVDLGALPAWPSQIGLDSVAAHFTSDHDDDAVFENNLVCLDVGAHIDGCVGDNACSVDLSGKYGHLIKASSQALDAAIKTARKGVALGEIGRAIQEAILKNGAVPVRNLSGHGISPWVIHDKPSVPNYDTADKRTLTGDQIIAIEPFSTTGAGLVQEAEQANIFALQNKKPVRSPFAREIMQFVEQNYGGLPFCSRWIIAKFGVGKTNLAINELMRSGVLHAYPPLVEKSGAPVAVFEKTLYIGEKTEVLTKI
ncbi:type II methionyl aminopeptidase [Candidatus Woesearchaeota archaeon]|nr:MAG: type II methionyl aminopeptidase [Candidatus Woesearchaeota archaeon]